MIDIVVSETEKIFCKAIKTFSKNDMLDQTQVSFLLSLTEVDGENVVKYELCHEHIPVRETNIKEILGVKNIDFKGYTYFVPPRIKQILEDFSKLLDSNHIEIAVYLNREDEDKIRYFLFDKAQKIKEFFLGDVLKIENG
jgi:hypothetical protein